MLSSPVSPAREVARTWQAVLGRLQLELNGPAFATWLAGTRALRREGNLLVVEAASPFAALWLEENLVPSAENAAASALGESIRVQFVAPGASIDGDHADTPRQARPRPVIGAVNRAFTFDRYLPTTGNRLALEACTGVLDGPPATGPVSLYGGPGVGKTHLLHALALCAAERGVPTACLSAEEFTNRYQGALRDRSVGEFHAELRSVRLLVIDDLQDVSGMPATLKELVHTFDAVANAGGAIVLASETNPVTLDLPERLTSRICAGILTAIDPPAAEERRILVARTARDHRVSLPAWAIDRLAAVNARSVRLILGAVNAAMTLLRCDRLDEGALDAELARLTAGEVLAERPEEEVIDGVLARFAATFEEVTGRSRRASVAAARAVLVVALHQRGESFAAIGRRLNDRDRSTIRDLHERGQRIIAGDPDIGRLLAG